MGVPLPALGRGTPEPDPPDRQEGRLSFVSLTGASESSEPDDSQVDDSTQRQGADADPRQERSRVGTALETAGAGIFRIVEDLDLASVGILGAASLGARSR